MQTIEDYEDAVVSALRCEVSEYEIQIWAKAYENLLQSLTSNRARGLNKKTSAALRGNGMDAVRGLVHGGKTFRIAQRLLQKYPAPEGPMIEVGAGWGPFAFAAADYAFTPITLMEKSKRMLEYAKAAFEKAGHKEPKCLIQDIGDHINYRNYSCFAAPFVLNELLHGVADHEKQEAALRWVRLWMRRLRPGGRLYLIEPGTVEASEVIQKLRNKLKDEYQIVGPCTHSMDCPMEERPKDWCHFTLRISSGPLARRIAELASRRFQDIHFSWLVVENSKPTTNEQTIHRVLDVRRNDKKKLKLVTCSAAGHHEFIAQKRDKAVFQLVKEAQAGDTVRLDINAYEKKGDGIRLTNEHCPEHLSTIHTLDEDETD